tara:strand:+ start:103 stop:411 length:309 start_codon:yes stop_codon:yes gene_type:complete
MQHKRGQGLSRIALVLIIFGAIVLISVVLFFVLRGSGQKEDNVTTIFEQCAIACAAKNKDGFCIQQRTLISSDLSEGEVIGTCDMFVNDFSYITISCSMDCD